MPFRRLTITIDDLAFRWLADVADVERRNVRDQAAYLVERTARRAATRQRYQASASIDVAAASRTRGDIRV
jgi:hypothetical protein